LDAPLNDYPFLKPQTAEMAGNTGTEQTHA
jgi:hypothetical protein